MSVTVEVITEALRDEAKKWHQHSNKLEWVKAAVDDLTLAPGAFYVGTHSLTDSQFNALEYAHFKHFISKLLAGGIKELDQMGDALKKIADHFDRTDQTNAINLEGIYYRSE